MKNNQTCSSLEEKRKKRKMGVPRKDKGVEIEETKPHFFTVIVSPSLQLHKLKLPKKFVKDHGKQLSNVAYLRVPNGVDWLVEIRKHKCSLSLHKGWNHFAEHYSISHGHALVFRYDGNSRFQVLIFSTATVEIDYSCNINLHQSANTSGEILDDLLHQSEVSEKSPGKRNQQAVPKTKGDAKDRVQQRADAFQSRNPFFMVHILERNFNGNTGPLIPVGHCRKYFERNGHKKDIVLCVNEKTWRITCRYEKFRPFCISMTFGWKYFLLSNHLKEGDICVFELIDLATMAYNVHVFRIHEQTLIDEETEDDILDDAFQSRNPFFTVSMKRSQVYYKRGPVFPTSHCRIYFTKNEIKKDIVLQINKRTWCVKYCVEKLPTFCISLSSGWREFMVENELELGDVCQFELIDASKKAYNVQIFRASKEMSEPILRDKQMKDEDCSECDTPTEMLDEFQQQTGRKSSSVSQRQTNRRDSKKILCDAINRVGQKAKAFQSQNPFFTVHVKKRHFRGNGGPALPTNHGRTYFTENDHEKYIVVCVNKKTWHIKCRLEAFGSFCLSLSTGWKMFVLDNDLKEGDACIFELIDPATKTYNLHVFRVYENNGKPNLVDEKIEDDIPIDNTSGKKGRYEYDDEKANSFVNGSPGFILHMNRSYIVLHRSVHVPRSHSTKYLKDYGDDGNVIVIYGKGRRSWKLKYRIESCLPKICFGSWIEFRSDNGLAIGDVCAFKLIDGPQKAYQVAIFRANGK